MPNEFRIGRSARYAALTTVLHAGAAILAAAVLARSSPAIAPLLVVLLALTLRRDLITVAWRSAPDAVVRIEVRARRWTLQRRAAPSFGPATLETFRTAGAGVLLVLRDDNGVRERVTLPADAVDRTALRRIRVHAHAAVTGPAG